MKNEKLEFGCGKAKLDFSNIIFPINGFSGIDDDLFARAIIFNSNQKILIISIEVPSLIAEVISEIKKEVSKEYSFKEQNIWISVTHSFCAPHITSKNIGTIDLLKKAVKKSVELAIQNYQEVRLGYSICELPVNVNRNIETPFGWWLGKNNAEFSNHDVRIIKVTASKSGQVLSILLNYDVQSSIMDKVENQNNQLQITPDLMGIVCKKIEDCYNDSIITLFLLGAAGDQVPIFQGRKTIISNENLLYKSNYQQGRKYLERLSSYFANSIYSKMNQIKVEESTTIKLFRKVALCNQKIMPVPTKELQPTTAFDFTLTKEKIEVEIEAILIGDILLIATKPELNSAFGKQILQKSPTEKTMLCTMINGGMKYLPEELDFKRITYTAMNTKLAQGSSEQFYHSLLELYSEIEIK